MTDTTVTDAPPVFGPDGRMMGNQTSNQGQPPQAAPALAPQSPLATMGPPPAPTPPPPQQHINAPPMPRMPAEQKLGPAPDAREYEKNSMAFASAMAVLGAVAGRFTRMPGGAALGAFAGALKGWQTGNLEMYESAAKKWEQDTKTALENNRQVMEKYKLALQNRQMNIDEQMSNIQLISAQYHDQIMYDAASSKNYTLVAQLYEKNLEYTGKAQQAADVLQEKRKEQQQKNEQSATYWLSPEGQNRMAQLSPAQQAGVKQLIDIYGQKAVGKSAIAQNRQQYINEFTDEFGHPPTSAEITQWEAERAGVKAEASTVGRRAGNIAIAVQEAHDTIPNVEAAAAQSAGKGLATWNKVENKWNVEKGDANFAYYVQQLNSLINVYGRVISGGGKGTVSDLEHAREMLNPNMPLSAVKGALRGFSTEVDIAEKAPEKVRGRMRGNKETPAQTTDTGPPSEGIPAGWDVKVH
jgi:hypothetical protein